MPWEAKRGNAQGLASGLGAKLDKDSYDTAREKLESCKEKACSIIPEFDAKYAAQMQEVTAATNAIKGVVEDLRQFLLETPLTTDCSDFAQVLAAKETQWKKQLKDARSLLDGAVANAKGAQKISTLFSKDPVNLSTGNFIYDREDLRIEGNPPFLFRRFYNSVNDYQGSLGKDWNHNYEVRLTFRESSVFEGEEVTILLEDGKEELFLPVDGGGYAPGQQSLASLEKTADGYEYRTLSGVRYLFDAGGRYVRQEDANGEGFSLVYGCGFSPACGDACGLSGSGIQNGEDPKQEERLSCIQKDTGESYRLDYDEAGYLRSVTDHTGRTFSYEVSGGRLVGAVRPDGGAFTYEYDGNGKLAGVTNPRGILTVENEFDEQYRTTLQKFPDGTKMCYDYDDERRTLTMTERNGSTSVHIHDEKYRNIRNIYPDGEERFEYNFRNQKTKVTDKLGHVTRLSYDHRGNLTGAVNPLGVRLSVTYGEHNRPVSVSVDGKQKLRNVFDRTGNLLTSRDALGRETGFSYDGKGRVTEVRQADGSRVLLSYDHRGNITELTDARGGVSRYVYDSLNRVVEAADAKGNRTRYTYDHAGNILSVTNPAGEVRRYEYNESHKVTKITDFDGSVIQRTYNVLNKPEVVTDQLGRKTTLQYDAMWNLARVTAPDGGRTTYLYNENNRLTRVKDALGNVTRYTYDGNGNRLSEEAADGAVTRFTYDAVGRLVKVTEPDGAETCYAYDSEGNLTRVTDALGNTVTMEYDGAGQLIKETNPLGENRSYTYTALGDVESMTDEAGRVTRYQYLPGGQVEKILYPDGTEEGYTYDANGNVESYTQRASRDTGSLLGAGGSCPSMDTNRDGFTLSYTYDSLDRIRKISGSGGEQKSYTYDAAGNVTSMTDALGNITRYEYTLAGELEKVIDALGNGTEYRYDPCGRLTEIRQYGADGSLTEGADIRGMDEQLLEAERTNQRNRICHVTKYQRNLSGQIETVTDALGQTEHYRYDKKGQLHEKVDKEGYLTKYGYTHRGDVEQIRYADGREVKLSYNPLRQLTEMEDWLGITEIKNDALGRAEKVTYPDGRSVSYTYGKTGERTSITYPDGRTIHYGFDENLRLSELKDGDRIISYAYNQAGRLAEKRFPNGMRSSYRYDPKGQIIELLHEDREGVLDRYQYQYDLSGNKTGITKERRGLKEESGDYRYGYDAIGRLESVMKDGDPLRCYSYDAFGNRINLLEGRKTTVYTYNALNQLISKKDTEGETAYQYDRRGNLTEAIRNGNIRNQYIYGALNRLERAVNGKGEATNYQYNGLGYRIGKQEGRVTDIRRLGDSLDPLNQLEEQKLDPVKNLRYTIDLTRVYHNLLEREENQRRQIYLWDGNVASFCEEWGGSQQYYLQDELGSPLRIGGENGDLIDRYGYDEFGRDLYRNQGKVQPFGYTGYQHDDVARTYFAQAREYKESSGNFCALDKLVGSMSLPVTHNSYIYCAQKPLDNMDSTGHWFGIDDAIAAGVGAVLGVASQAASDVVLSVIKGKPQISSWQDYVGAAAGGAAGGVTTLYAGPVVGAMVEGAVSTLSAEGLKAVTKPNYNRDVKDVLIEAVGNTVLGGVCAFGFNGFKFKSEEGISAISKSYRETYESLYDNPRIQRLLSSDRKYYIDKAIKELQKAKESYAEDVVLLAKEALKGGLSLKDLSQSIMPNLTKEAKEVFLVFVDIIKNNEGVASIICTDE